MKELLTGWRDYMRAADESLTTILNIMPSLGDEPPGVMLGCCFAGEDASGARSATDPLKKLGNLVKEDVTKKPYAEVLEEAFQPEGVRVIVKNAFAESFSDELISAVSTAAEHNPDLILQIRSLGGAMKRIPAGATAFPHRNSEVMLVCPTFVRPDASGATIQESLKPWNTIAEFGKGAYSGFISTVTDRDVADIYPKETYVRLASIKKTYDPDNLFSRNFNIRPA